MFIGGRIDWTPATLGTFTITVETGHVEGDTTYPVVVGATFTVIVDDNTMTYPNFRDYLNEQNTVEISGRAYGTNFVSYTLDYGAVNGNSDSPTTWFPIAGPSASPVETTGRLALWDVSSLPDGGRYHLRLTVNLVGGDSSVLINPVIIDRTIKTGWDRRLANFAPITRSPIVADLNDDGLDEVLTVGLTEPATVFVFHITGELMWSADSPSGLGYGGVSVGDIDGDKRPDVIWTSSKFINGQRGDGSSIPGFPLRVFPSGVSGEFRTPPTLADLDNDGADEIVVGSTHVTPVKIFAYKHNSALGTLQLFPGWPQQTTANVHLAAASVGDINGDGISEIITAGVNRVYAWHANATPVPGLHNAVLAQPITNADAVAADGANATSQPAIADINNDGVKEIVIGSNVLQPTGTYLQGWEGGRNGVINSISPAIGDVDANPANGMEVVLGQHSWHADGTLYRTLAASLTSPILGNCGAHVTYVDLVAGLRDSENPGFHAFHLHDQANALSRYPKRLYGRPGDMSGAVIGDFDSDTKVDVAVTITDATYGGVVVVYNMNRKNYDEDHPWPMMGHNMRRTGYYTVAPPNRPAALVATRLISGVALNWVDESLKEDRYVIERSLNGAAFSYQRIAQLSANTTSYTDQSAPVGVVHYRVRAERQDVSTGRWIVSRAAYAASPTSTENPPPEIESSWPPNLYVDPREDRDPVTGTLLGTSNIVITLSEPVMMTGGGPISLGNFRVKYFRDNEEITTPPYDLEQRVAPTVRLESGSTGAGPYNLIFSPRIALGAWTQVEMISVTDQSGSPLPETDNRIIIGSLPMDITQDGMVLGDDITRWLQIYKDLYLYPAPLTKSMLLDQRRDNVVSPTDIQRAIDLLNGIGTLQVWMGYDIGSE